MKQLFINLLATALLLVGASAVAQVQINNKTTAEIAALRGKIAAAIKTRDRQTLENLYADDFTHTHASGVVDDKTKRINALASGDATIESAETSEIKIRAYGKNTAVAVGQSTIENARYRWIVVYFKTGKTWRVVASQATRIAEK